MNDLWLGLSVLALAIWVYLLVARGGFWLARERNDVGAPAPSAWPSVAAVVPARDEADVIARTIGSLLAQDYPGPFRIVLVDDQSSDGTADLARALDNSGHLEVISGESAAVGLDGKVVGRRARRRTREIEWPLRLSLAYRRRHRARAAKSRDARRARRSRTPRAGLRNGEASLRELDGAVSYPAFVYFFDMLYPFGWVNNPHNRTAAAAGGSMLARRDALEAAGGIEAIRGEIIDDCALGRRMKTQGPIWLGLTEMSESIRPYEGMGEIGRMVSRSAYAQLHYSPFLLAGTAVAMLILYVVPALAALAPLSPAGLAGLLAWLLMMISFQPMLRFYRVSPLWGLALPMIGLVYTLFTVDSAWQFWKGRGGMWKGRAQAMTRA